LNEGLLLAPLPAVVLANLGLRETWARAATFGVAGAIALATAVLLPLFDLALEATDPRAAAAAGVQGTPALVACGGLAVAVLWPGVRSGLARVFPIDPESPVHLLAVVLTLCLLGLQLQSAFSGVLSQEAGSAQPLTRVDLVLGELPFLLAAFLGVGLFVRRDPRQSLDRLGFAVPAWWHVGLALVAAGAFFAVAVGLDQLGQVLTPGTARQVNSATNRIFGPLTADPTGVVTIAVAAGVCEEALFRGALQPRLGILWTSLVFASVHTQYGISFDALAVLVLAIGLGLLRRFASTTASTVCHISYDLLTGFGVSTALLPWAGAVEGALIALLLAALVTSQRRRREQLAP
jgi:CAAX protease family protein